jgi:hypothetical protein
MLIDHVLDKGKLLGVDLSDTIKEENYQSLRKEAFALPEARLFPIHTPTDALLSALYLYKQAAAGEEVPEEVFKKVATALDLHGVKQDFIKQAKKLTPEERAKLPDSVFGLVVTDPKTGKKIRKYPMPDEGHVRAAIKYFVQNYKNYPIEWRKQIASKIVERAKKFGIEVEHPVILKYAGVKPQNKKADLKKAASLIETYRAAWFESHGIPEAAEVYRKLASALEKEAEKGDLSEEEIQKLAAAVETLDQEFGVDYEKLPSAQDLIYCAEEEEKMIKLASKEVPEKVLKAIPNKVYKNLIGREIDKSKVEEEITKLAHADKLIIEQFIEGLMT